MTPMPDPDAAPTWEPMTAPTVEQIDEWMTTTTAANRRWYLEGAVSRAREAHRCWLYGHESQIDELRAVNDDLRAKLAAVRKAAQ